MKRGFTLVELLAVIVILGLIGLIVFPVVDKAIKNSKEKVYEKQVAMIENAAKNMAINNTYQLSEEGSIYISIDDIIANGYLEVKEIKDPRTDKKMTGCVVITFVKDYNQYTYVYDEECERSPICANAVELGYEFNQTTGTITGYDGNDTVIDIPKSFKIGDQCYTVLSLDDDAFKSKQLTSVTIPDSVTSIGNFTFRNNQLTSITIPDSVTYVGDYAFYDNYLTSVIIPSSVTYIGSFALAGNQLTSVTIPNSITHIENCTFYSNLLTSVTIPDGVKSIGNSAFHGNQLTSVTIPNSVTSIEDSAFMFNKLTSVTIPNGVTSIGSNAFYSNQLTSITIPNSVRTIGTDAFKNNNILQGNAKIDNTSGSVTIYSGAFDNNGASQSTTITPIYLR